MTVEWPRWSCSDIQAASDSSQGHRSTSSSGWPARILATFASEWNWSASANTMPVARAIPCATVVLPHPETPMTTTCRRVGPSAASPVMDRAVLEPVEGQVRRLVGEALGRGQVERDAEPGLLAGVQVAVREGEGLREHLVREGAVAHVLLDPEVVDGQ